MSLVRLIYASRFTNEIDIEQLQAILEVSRKKNPERAITGALCYGPGVFLQCIEGPRPLINTLYRDIINDSRNKDVTLLEYSDENNRLFQKWSMAYVRTDTITESIAKEYFGTGQFDPFSMEASQALGFMQALIAEEDAFIKMMEQSQK